MIVKLRWIRFTGNFDKFTKWHAVIDAHVLHGLWYIIILKHFIVVGSNQPVKRIADETEAEITFPKFSRLSGRNQLSFAMCLLVPESIGSGFQPTIRLLFEDFAKACFD